MFNRIISIFDDASIFNPLICMRTKSELFPDTLAELAEQIKAISHPARLAILQYLAARDTCICGDIVDVLPLAQATVSQHLKVLKAAGLVQGEVDGPRSCYCIDRIAAGRLKDSLDRYFQDVTQASPEAC